MILIPQDAFNPKDFLTVDPDTSARCFSISFSSHPHLPGVSMRGIFLCSVCWSNFRVERSLVALNGGAINRRTCYLSPSPQSVRPCHRPGFVLSFLPGVSYCKLKLTEVK